MGIKYVENPLTIGEKIRNRRLELRLLQKDVALTLAITDETLTNWENNYHNPEIHHCPGIIAFLGYYPFPETDDFADQIKKYRYLNGLSQKQMGKKVGVDGSTISDWENCETMPKGAYLRRLQKILKNAN